MNRGSFIAALTAPVFPFGLPLLFIFLLLLGTVFTARADQINCSDFPYNGVIDGNLYSYPDNIKIDTNCTIKNYPGGMSTNFSFDNNDPTPYLVIFDNVVHTGQMACNTVAGHRIWFVNGSSTSIQDGCQNLLIPVEKIDKQNPSPFATVGVPFTYKLTIPVLYDAATGNVINSSGSVNDLHSIILTDDLTATGVDLSYVSHVVYWQDSHIPVPHSFSNGGGVLTFSNFTFGDPYLPAGEQIVIEVTVVLNDTPVNSPGKIFTNTAKWSFGRYIAGTYYEPLPGEWGISQPMIIVAPNLVVTKTGPSSVINLGAWTTFTIDVWNSGPWAGDAWNVDIIDQLPSVSSNAFNGGMCDLTPEVTSVTLAGSPLILNTHYLLSYTNCEISLTLLDAAGPIGPDEHLIISYRTKVDAGSESGALLTNVAAATQWTNDTDDTIGQTYTCSPPFDGTEGTADCQDAHDLLVALSGYFFEKSVTNPDTGVPVTTALPGDTLRYTLRLQSIDQTFTGLRFYDDLGILNALPAFEPGSLKLISYPAGANISNTNPNGGTNSAGILDIRNLSVLPGGVIQVQFDIRVATTLTENFVILNQADLRNSSGKIADSDDPNINGQADPAVDGDEDPTRVVITFPQPPVRKTVENLTTGQSGSSATPGDRLRYTITIENAYDFPLYGLSMVDDIEGLNASPMFQPGSIRNVSLPFGAGYTINGSTLTVSSLNIGANETASISFEALLEPVITNGTIVLNQGQITLNGIDIGKTDDPNVSGQENPTETLIISRPIFQVQKTSTIMSGDPNILMAGETLRYTITIKNIGTEDALNVRLRDYTPANTTYVANSTTLNGLSIADPSVGISPLRDGMLINAPADGTPGVMRANTTPTPNNVATVTFDVTVNPDVLDGTLISNQGFVTGNGAGSGSFPQQPSDDPNTPIPDDPTRNVVGNLPLLYATKTVEIADDFSSPEIVDPGDVLGYTIVISNFGAIPATGVLLTDTVPVNTTYMANTLELNGSSVGTDGGVFPLLAGLPVHSPDNPGEGIVSAGESAVIYFEVLVNVDVPADTIISNQGSLTSSELPPGLTDADGVPSNGNQPTVIVVGEAQLLSITKEVLVIGNGMAEAGGQLEYVVRVTNIGSLPATAVVLTDNLSPPLGNQVSYVAGSGTLNGSSAGVTYAGAMLTADYNLQYGDLQPGDEAVMRFRVEIDPALAIGTTIINTGEVRWSDSESALASVSIDVGGTPGYAAVNGNVWYDANLDQVYDLAEQPLAGWLVDLYRNDQLINTVLTDADGVYRHSGLVPNSGTPDLYELRFRAAGSVANTASMGDCASPLFTNGPQRISDIIVDPGANLQNLNLPLQPNGAVYNSVLRVPMSGVRVSMLNAMTGAALPSQCFNDPVQQGQVTARDGFYKFDLNFSEASCPAGGSYLIEVTPPASGYMSMPSRVIPPSSDASTAPFSISDCPAGADDAIPATNEICEAMDAPAIPPTSVRPEDINYYLHLVLDNVIVPGHSQIFNNFIPVDPVLDGAVAVTKTSPLINVTRGELVPYTITVTNVLGVPLYDIAIVDRFPAGFKYVASSARLNGNPAEPNRNGLELSWNNLELQVNAKYTIKMLLIPGSGVSEGEYVNRALVFSTATGGAVSEEATATVRLVPDPAFSCTDVIGKVFDDRDLNGQQGEGEKGLAGVRLVTARGLIGTTDKYGRFHITCAAIPDEDRGSNFILKLDERSLPTGFRLTTENPRVQRATRGKMIRFNFGATIHRLVRIDISDGAFEPDTSELRLQWTPKIAQLLDELKKAPSVLRLSYLADLEGKGLVRKRLKALKEEITREWSRSDGGYRLAVETEVFWRRGAPLAGK